MASDRSIVDHIVTQAASGGEMRANAMSGEYGLCCDGRMVALFCDNRL
ncbi:hypothetical protein [Pelagovum pacificum]|nr:hypothetical protein [Pelagovum pacificum]QQA45065.1 hypothetical protein I8N54_19630 [Pelagovum pacificum]